MDQTEKKTQILLGVFVSTMVLVNIIGTKITTIFGFRVSFGIFLFPILFLVTDIVGEVHGRKRAQFFVRLSSAILVFMFLMVLLSIKMAPNPTWDLQPEYAAVLGSSLRMTLASVLSFFISQSFDVAAFDFWRTRTGGKHLWLRNNLSTMSSQFIDTTIFMFLAFYQISPKFTVPVIFSMIIPYWLFKVAFAFLDTPLCYLGVRWLQNKPLKSEPVRQRT
jgi:uncharacterized integral membrane protein (TIGR00697 family)